MLESNKDAGWLMFTSTINISVVYQRSIIKHSKLASKYLFKTTFLVGRDFDPWSRSDQPGFWSVISVLACACKITSLCAQGAL